MATAAMTGIGGTPTHEHPLNWIITGDADPSAGAGIAAAVGSLYARNDAGTGSLWVKVGAANTEWTLVTLEA
jgi:hypothetical protein